MYTQCTWVGIHEICSKIKFPNFSSNYQYLPLLQNLAWLQNQTEEILNNTQFMGRYEYIPNAEQCFDATWALALALNRTMQSNC